MPETVETPQPNSDTRVVFRAPFEVALESCGNVAGTPLGPNEIVLATRCSLISPGTELAFYTGTHVGLADPANTWAKYPFYPGYAAVGEVAGVGEEVRDLKAGDRIYAIARHASHSRLSWSPSQPVLKLPDDLPDEHAVFTRLATIAMTAPVVTEFAPGDSVAVLGAGLIGNFAAQLFALQGARVIVVDTVAERLARARQCGIERTLLGGEDVDVEAGVRDMNGGQEPDVVIEATGVPALVVTALEMVRRHGQVVLLGSPRGSVEIDVYRHIHAGGVRLFGAHENLQDQHGLPNRHTLSRHVLDLIARGDLKVAPLLTHRLPARDAKLAYEMLLREKDKALGMVLDWRCAVTAE
ncbi:MAG: zinc-binding dehydrogenase [Armatimonadota bacterium]|nr:zinc-binding dehydrogenase [Armatimonadota bacterium]